MNILIKELENLKKFKEYVSDINKKISPIVLSGLSSVGKIQLLEATKEFADRNICIVTYNELQAKKIYKDLKYFSALKKIKNFSVSLHVEVYEVYHLTGF